MPIDFIETEQPVMWNIEQQPCLNKDNQSYAQLLQADDPLCIQWKNEPCDDTNLFDCQILGNGNHIVDPEMEAAPSWVVGAGWSFGGGKATHTTGTARLGQVLGTIVAGNYYLFVFVVSGRTAGSVTPETGFIIDTISGSAVTTNGEHRQVIQYDDSGGGLQVGFLPTNDFDGAIESFYMYDLGPTYGGSVDIALNGDFAAGSTDWTVGGGWSIAAGKATHTPGSTNLLAQANSSLVLNAFYLTIYTVSDMTAGTVRIVTGEGAGAIAGTMRSANGTYYEVLEYGDAIDQSFHFDPSSDFDGSIDDVQVWGIPVGDDLCMITNGSMFIDWTYDIDTGVFCHVVGNTFYLSTRQTALTAAATFYKICFTISDMTAGSIVPVFLETGGATQQPFVDLEGNTITITGNGDYCFYQTSTLASQLMFLPSSDFDGCIDPADISVLEMDVSHTVNLTNVDGQDNSESFDITSDHNPLIYENNYITWCPDWTLILEAAIVGDPIITGCYRVKITDGCTAEEHLSDTVINYKRTGEHACPAKWISAYNDGYGYGFNFNTFRLGMRARLLKISPRWPSEGETYIYSTGRHKRLFGQITKIWTAWFDKMDETALGCLAHQLRCDNLTIDDVAYFCPSEDFTPEWAENMKLNLAQVRVDLIKLEGTLFNKNI